MTESKSLWGFRLLALALAGLAWFVFSGEKREPQSEKVVEAAVQYDAPTNYVLLERVETVRITARGPLSKIRSLTAPFVDVFVALPEREGQQQLALGDEQVILPEGLELVSIEPNVILFKLDRQATRVVPVQADLQGEPAAGAQVLSVRIVPNQALVGGPASVLDSLDHVLTTTIDLSGHGRDFQQEVALLPPAPLIRIQGVPIVNVIVQLEIPNVTPDDGPDDELDPSLRN